MMMPMAEFDKDVRLGRQLGDRLETLRRAHNWTQGQIAYKTGLNKATVSQMLAGARKDPPIGTVMRFAEAFGVTLDELMGLKPLQIPEPAEAEPADRLAKLEAEAAKVPQLAEQVAELASTMKEFLQRQSQQAPSKPSRSAKAGHKKAS